MSASHRMRNLSFVIATVLTAGLAAGTAQAEKHALQGKHGLTDVAGACAKAGGVLFQITGLYGCIKSNCDGKGGECKVECTDSSHCTGTTPGIVSGKPGLKVNPTLLDTLTGGPKFQTQQPVRSPKTR